MSFHEVLFPVDIALNSEGGPTRRTDIVALVSGHEERNSPWAGSRRAYNAGYGVKCLSDIEDAIAFFEARHGRLYGFRFRDPFDFKSCRIAETPDSGDQLIGQGDGATVSFQLTKRYASGGASYARAIRKPVAGTALVAVDGAEKTPTSRSTRRPALSPSPRRRRRARPSPPGSCSTRRSVLIRMNCASTSPRFGPGTSRRSR